MKILKQGEYVWGEWKKLYKQGKVLHDIEIFPIEEYQGMVRIKPVPESEFDREANPNYPDYWVEKVKVTDSVTPGISFPSTTISDVQASQAILTVLRWFKQK